MGRGYGMIVAICSVMAVLAECKYAPLDGLKSPAPYSQESAASHISGGRHLLQMHGAGCALTGRPSSTGRLGIPRLQSQCGYG